MLVSVPEENRDDLQRDILAVPDLRSAVFVIDPNGASTAKPTPTIGCTYFVDTLFVGMARFDSHTVILQNNPNPKLYLSLDERFR